jgi:class 3 adenylate cyclase
MHIMSTPSAMEDSATVPLVPTGGAIAGASRAIRDLRRSYFVAMGMLMLLDSGITGIFIFVAGRSDVAVQAALLNILMLGGLNLAVAGIIFAPIGGLVRDFGDLRGISRLQRLATWSGRWAFTVTLLYCFAAFYSGVFSPKDANMESIDLTVRLLALPWYSFVYAANYAFCVYFLVDDVVARFRAREGAALGLVVPPLNSRLEVKLGAIFFVLAFLPATLVGLDLSLFADLRRVQGLTPTQTIALDMVASLFTISISLAFAARSILRPVALLDRAQQAVGQGELDARVPVVSNDEIGRLTASFNSMVAGLRERELIRDAFGRYLNPALVGQLISGGGKLESRMLEATVMFTDITGFTAISEKLSPDDTVKLLNDYFAVVNEAIHAEGGYINNFIGDAVVAVFNVPAPQPDHAARAIRAARAIQAALSSRIFAHGGALPTRIGINTGTVCAGLVGSADRMGYTVYGDAVNVAARVEVLNKELGTAILLTETTVALAPECGPFVVQGVANIRGRSEGVEVFSV